MAVTIEFDPERLRLARHLRGLKVHQLATAVGVTSSAISQYEASSCRPSSTTLARLSLALGMPAGFFARRAEPAARQRGVTHFRSLRSCTQAERHRAMAHAALACEVAHVLERRVRFPPVSIEQAPISDDPTREELEDAAAVARERFGLSAGPVPNVVRLLELGGTIVTRHSLDTGRVDAFACDFTTRPVVVLGADKGDKARSRFDAAHELAHLIMHQEATPGASELERQADAFASAFLMPATEIASEFPARISWARLLELKHVWGVSLAALLFRARTLALITETAYRRSMATMSQRGWRIAEPGELGDAEQPTALRRALEFLTPTGYAIETLADEVSLPVETVELIIGADDRPTLQLTDEEAEDGLREGARSLNR